MNKNESKYFNTAALMDEALLQLLEKKEYEFITVTDVCKKAGVSRSAFYLHYESVDDLLSETIEYINSKFTASFKPEDTKISLDDDKKNLIFIQPKYLTPYLSFIKENQKIFILGIKRPGIMRSDEMINSWMKGIFSPIMDSFNIEKKYQPYIWKFYCAGLVAIINSWIKGGCKESIEDILDIIMYCSRMNDIHE